MNHKPILTRLARTDLRKIISYIAERNFNASLVVYRKITNSIYNLQKFPKLGTICEFNKLVRKLIVDKYIIYYVVDSITKQVSIARILHSSMDQKSHLKKTQETS